MKTNLLFLIALALCNTLSSQSDQQWLIWNSLGKEGLQDNGILNNYRNTIRPNFTLFGVEHAAWDRLRPARADLFFIYDDGSHFNSRYLDDPGFFVPTATSLSTYTNHNFSEIHSGGNIAYGYLTRSYEGDDPPGSVRAASAWGGQNSTAFSVDITEYPSTTEFPNIFIRASHDVVKGRDITIIIDQDMLDSIAKQNQDTFNYQLVFNQIIASRTDVPRAPSATDNYFKVEPIFYQNSRTVQPGFPLSSFEYNSSTPDRIKLKREATKKYTYINLRPTDAIDDYGPDATGSRYNAIFDIVNGSGVSVTQLAEPILQSHDPNFIRVDSIKCEGGNQMVYYHLQFQNTSPTTAANSVAVGFVLPSQFIESDFLVTEWSLRGAHFPGTLTKRGRDYRFEFLSTTINKSLDVCVSEFDIKTCTGYIKFKVAVPGDISLRNIDNSLQMQNPHTVFDGQQYSIDIFEDLIIRDPSNPNKWIRNIDCIPEDEGNNLLCWILWIIGILILGLIVYFIWKKITQGSTTQAI